jgi:NADH:ubiquinone oxidoreductase subunit 3 (subunit A)
MMFMALLIVGMTALMLYLLGALVAHKPRPVRAKREPYAAGIRLPIIRQRYESALTFFIFVFLILDVVAFLLYISRGGPYPIAYFVIVMLGLLWVGLGGV